jgi:hypothetical protein
LQALGSNKETEDKLTEDGLLRKLVLVAKYFDSKNQIDKNGEFAKKTVSAETIFESFLLKYNPSCE